MSYESLKLNFTGGILSPAVQSRYDFEKYHTGLHEAKNVYVHIEGGISKRPGTRKLIKLEDANSRRLIPFSSNKYESNLIIMLDEKIDIYGKHSRDFDTGPTQTELKYNHNDKVLNVDFFMSDLSDDTTNKYGKINEGDIVQLSTSELDGINFKVSEIVISESDEIKYSLKYLNQSECKYSSDKEFPKSEIKISVVGKEYSKKLTKQKSFGGEAYINYYQANDTIYMVHDKFYPKKLIKKGEEHWTLEDVKFITNQKPIPKIYDYAPKAPVAQKEPKQHRYKITAVNTDTGEESSPVSKEKRYNCLFVHQEDIRLSSDGKISIQFRYDFAGAYERSDQINWFSYPDRCAHSSDGNKCWDHYKSKGNRKFNTSDKLRLTGLYDELDGKEYKIDYIYTGEIFGSIMRMEQENPHNRPAIILDCNVKNVTKKTHDQVASIIEKKMKDIGIAPLFPIETSNNYAEVYHSRTSIIGFVEIVEDSVKVDLNVKHKDRSRVNRVELSWDPAQDASAYNIYKEKNGVYGFIGTTHRTQFDDDGIEPEMSNTIPRSKEPFKKVKNRPSAVTMHEQRSIWGRSLCLWFSQTSNLENMNASTPIRDTDAFNINIPAIRSAEIRHVMSAVDSLLVFTSNCIHALSPGGETNALLPTSVKQTVVSGLSTTKLPPLVIGDNILIVSGPDDFGFEIYSIKRSGGDTTKQDLTVLSRELFLGYKIIDWTYAHRPNRLLVCIRDDGKCLVMSYYPEENINAWTIWETHEGEFKNVTCLSDGEYDVLYFVVAREDGDYLEKVDFRDRKYVDSWSLDGTGVKLTAEIKSLPLFLAQETVTKKKDIKSISVITDKTKKIILGTTRSSEDDLEQHQDVQKRIDSSLGDASIDPHVGPNQTDMVVVKSSHDGPMHLLSWTVEMEIE